MDAIVWIGLAALAAFNAFATRKAWRCGRLKPRVRAALIAAVWLLPVYGAVVALLAAESSPPPARMRVRIVVASHGARGARAGAGAAFWSDTTATFDSGGSDGWHCSGDSGAGCHGGSDGGSGGDCGGGSDGGGGCH